MWVLKWDSGARRSVRIETRFRPERCCCCCSSWVACSALCGVTRRRSAASWRRLSTGCVRFQSRTLPVTPAGAAYLAGVRAGGAVGSICCAGLARSGADVALVLILQQPSPNLRGGGAAATRSSGRLCSRREAQRSWDERAPRSAHWATRTCGGETWFVRLGLRAQFARLLAAEMHGRLVAVFWHLRGRKLRCGDSGWWG